MSDQSSRGRTVMRWGAAVAVGLCLGAAVWIGQRSSQGTNIAEMAGAVSVNAQDSAADDAALQPQQIEAVKDFATSALRSRDTGFLVSMGAAVPQGVALQDMPRALGDALPAYINDQYVVVANRFVIVARSTRRIIAIVPTG